MTRFKTLARVLAATIALSIAVAPKAEARSRHGGLGLGVLAAGLIVGSAIAASRAHAAEVRECWIERRWVETPYGVERRRIRVCN